MSTQGTRASGGLVPRLLTAALAALVAVSGVVVAGAGAPADAADGDEAGLYLVTLRGPGLSGRSATTDPDVAARLIAKQDAVLDAVDAAAPIYRWTTALSGVAVRLTQEQAADIGLDPRVALVQRDEIRRLAGTVPTRASTAPTTSTGTGTGAGHGKGGARGRGGRGVVIGFIDSGLWPESPLFTGAGSGDPGVRPDSDGFRGTCQTAPDWPSTACTGKIAAARWFVDGFGAERLAGSASLSPRDDSGHGTQVASLAAGGSGVSVKAGGDSLGTYSGVAPGARIAVYKACWTAPDPADDGCSTADLVTAIDRATADGVDVLNLSVSGPAEVDTVELALLGAAEADVVAVAAAGNDGDAAYAAHSTPWVTTAGGSTGAVPLGRVRVAGGPDLTGAMTARHAVARTRIILAARAAAPGVPRATAAICQPGSLDARRVKGAIVVCERGLIGRIDKSAAVDQAGGAGMVLADVESHQPAVDVHAVPTVQLGAAASRRLLDHLARHRHARAVLQPAAQVRHDRRVADTSNPGDPAGLTVKPDVVADSSGLLAAVPPRASGDRFAYVAGTSASAAQVSGVAALLRARHDWSASRIRSVLSTSATRVQGAALRQGAGRLSVGRALRAGLVLDVDPSDYRRVLRGRLSAQRLNAPSVLRTGRPGVVVRRITNAGDEAAYFSSNAYGFAHHQVTVTPAAVRLQPGETTTFRIRIGGGGRVAPLDDGFVVWRGGDGTRVRIPVVLSR